MRRDRSKRFIAGRVEGGVMINAGLRLSVYFASIPEVHLRAYATAPHGAAPRSRYRALQRIGKAQCA
jgi:hypothetical protein